MRYACCRVGGRSAPFRRESPDENDGEPGQGARSRLAPDADRRPARDVRRGTGVRRPVLPRRSGPAVGRRLVLDGRDRPDRRAGRRRPRVGRLVRHPVRHPGQDGRAGPRAGERGRGARAVRRELVPPPAGPGQPAGPRPAVVGRRVRPRRGDGLARGRADRTARGLGPPRGPPGRPELAHPPGPRPLRPGGDLTPDADHPVVLVTGATSGIGRATARLLASNGYRVFGTSRDPTSRPPEPFPLLPLEVASDESAAACVRRVADATGGRIDVLVNNVGTGILGAAEESTAAEVRALFEVNVLGAVRMTNAVLPLMRARRAGRILNMSSSGGTASIPFAAYYCATKFALEAYSEGLRNELLPLGIHVSVVAPGPVSTPAGDTAARAAHPVADYEPARSKAADEFVKAIRAGMDPATVAEAILDLVRSDAPAPRRPVGLQSHATGWARRLLPVRAFQALVRWAVGRS
ncbi:MAG: hypothetical protein C0501_22335 [Isosphaera sp.]|nr:hypothetical protein [Isosphaera sp.]